jgi:hypothetical protein
MVLRLGAIGGIKFGGKVRYVASGEMSCGSFTLRTGSGGSVVFSGSTLRIGGSSFVIWLESGPWLSSSSNSFMAS